jgi:hypothetical protein
MRTNFTIVEITDDYILLEDNCIQTDAMSITNGAEEVIEYLSEYNNLSDHQIVYYIDTDYRVDILKHRHGKFTGFSAGFDTLNDFRNYMIKNT